MKSRRLKIGMVSMHIIAAWGKEMDTKVKESLPSGTEVLMQQTNFERGGMDILLYNDEFEEVAEGYELPRMIIDIPLKDVKSTSSIILTRR